MIKELLILGTLLFSQHALGATSEANRAIEQFRNLLTNPGGELSYSGWTASGGSLTTSTTAANVGEGNAALSWDASATSQTLVSSATIPAGLYGRNGVVSCNLKCASGTCTHTLTADDGTNNLATATTITSSSTYTKTNVNFVFPSSGSVRIKLTSAANEPVLYADSCYLGEATNLSQVSQAQFIGSAYIPGTTNCTGWTVTTASFSDFSSDSDCTGPTVVSNPGPGTIQTTDADLPQFTVNSLPPGNYRIILSGISYDSNSAGQVNVLRISDGTTTSGTYRSALVASLQTGAVVEGDFQYTTTANRTFKLQGYQGSGTMSLNHGTSATDKIWLHIYRFPSAAEVSVRTDQSPSSWSGTHSTDCSFTRTNAAFGAMATDASCTFAEVSNRNFGTVTSEAGSLPGIVFTPPRVGFYEVCANVVWTNSATASVGLRLTDGTNNRDFGFETNTAGQRNLQLICGYYNVSTLAAKTFSVHGKSSTGTLTFNGAESTVVWTVKDIDNAVAAPIFAGSVNSNSTGVERIERLKFTNSGTPTISSQSGSWVTSLTDNGTGDTTIVIPAGIFSVAPACSCTTSNNSTKVCSQSATATTTAVRVLTFTSSTGAASDADADVVCMGSR